MNLLDIARAIDIVMAELPSDEQLSKEQHSAAIVLRTQITDVLNVVAAARNLIAQKGRHNTEIAYKRLEEAVGRLSHVPPG